MILGQDPYHGPGQAHGLCFSVKRPVNPPPSLINMYKLLEKDIDGFQRPKHGCLVGWSKQGVLLLNACLTVRQAQANSHKDQVCYSKVLKFDLQFSSQEGYFVYLHEFCFVQFSDNDIIFVPP